MRLTMVRALAVAALALPLVPGAQGGARPGQAPGAGKTELTWYGHAAFVLKTPGGTVLAIDPWLSNPTSPDKGAAGTLPKVDYILLSHGHADHVGEAIAIAKRTGARLVANADLGRALVAAGYPKEQAGPETLGNMGGRVEAGDAAVTMVPALHSSTFVDPQGQAHPGGDPVGFVIQVKGGPTLYYTGDTDVAEEMRQIPERYGRIDVMMACIGGHFTMDPAGAALAASYVKPRAVVPMHFGTFPALSGTTQQLEAALEGRAKVMTLVPGKPTAL